MEESNGIRGKRVSEKMPPSSTSKHGRGWLEIWQWNRVLRKDHGTRILTAATLVAFYALLSQSAAPAERLWLVKPSRAASPASESHSGCRTGARAANGRASDHADAHPAARKPRGSGRGAHRPLRR